jgi:hypothetical protein
MSIAVCVALAPAPSRFNLPFLLRSAAPERRQTSCSSAAPGAAVALARRPPCCHKLPSEDQQTAAHAQCATSILRGTVQQFASQQHGVHNASGRVVCKHEGSHPQKVGCGLHIAQGICIACLC